MQLCEFALVMPQSVCVLLGECVRVEEGKVLRESSLRKELYAGVASQRVISKWSDKAARLSARCLLVSYTTLALYTRFRREARESRLSCCALPHQSPDSVR